MKIVFIIPDGLQDDNVVSGKTPVEYANAPYLHSIANKAEPLLLKTVYSGLPIGSIVANLGLLGYDPYRFFPCGRSYFELMARYTRDIGKNDLILRCNTISVNEEDIITDFTAGQISEGMAADVIHKISKYLPPRFELFHGKNYRNTLVVRESVLHPNNFIAFEPHSRIGSNVNDLRVIHGNCQLTKEQKREIQYLNSVMWASLGYFVEINKKVHSNANMLWFWEASYPVSLFNFSQKYHFNSPWLITGSDFLYGIANMANIPYKMNEKYTGEINTDYHMKGAEAVAKLKGGADFIYLHVNATDEESHQKRYAGKVQTIQEIDKHIIGPIFDCLQQLNQEYILIIGGDHYTSSLTGNHLGDCAPFIMFDSKQKHKGLSCFSEREIVASNPLVIEAKNLLPMLTGLMNKNEIQTN